MDRQQWEILQKMLAARQGAPGVPGMPGTPGGPVQESPTMQAERNNQMMKGIIQAGIGFPMGYAGVAGGNLPIGAIGAGLAASGMQNIGNSNAPNIRDVWADQLRMKMQGN